MSAALIEELGVPVLTTHNYELETAENAIDPLQERMDEKTNCIVNLWQFDDDDIKIEETEDSLNPEINQELQCNGWSSTRSSDTLNELFAAPTWQPQSKGPACNIENPVEAWHLLLDEPILSIILQHTNEAIRSRPYKTTDRVTDLTELRAWFGLNYLAGLFRNSLHAGPLDELWSLELGNAVFRATMPLQRYEFLASYICLSTKREKMYRNRVWKKFIVNCRSYYTPSAYVVVDNALCSEDHTLLLCDAKTLYLCNMSTRAGYSNSVEHIHNLVGDIKSSKRVVITGAQHSSVELAQCLQKDGLALLGELPSNASNIPREVLWTEDCTQPLYNGTMALYAGNLLSNCLDPNINAIQLYKSAHSACCTLQRLVENYNTHFAAPQEKRTSTNLQDCHTLLNYAAFNAWVLLRLSNDGDTALDQRDFLRQLGLYLTQQQLKRRLQQPARLSLLQKMVICEMLGEPEEKVIAKVQKISSENLLNIPDGVRMQSRFADKRVRCRKCKGKNSPKTRSRCQQCLRNLCYRHIVFRCDDCSGVTNLGELQPDKEADAMHVEFT